MLQTKLIQNIYLSIIDLKIIFVCNTNMSNMSTLFYIVLKKRVGVAMSWYSK